MAFTRVYMSLCRGLSATPVIMLTTDTALECCYISICLSST